MRHVLCGCRKLRAHEWIHREWPTFNMISYTFRRPKCKAYNFNYSTSPGALCLRVSNYVDYDLYTVVYPITVEKYQGTSYLASYSGMLAFSPASLQSSLTTLEYHLTPLPRSFPPSSPLLLWLVTHVSPVFPSVHSLPTVTEMEKAILLKGLICSLVCFFFVSFIFVFFGCPVIPALLPREWEGTIGRKREDWGRRRETEGVSLKERERRI